MKRRINKDFIVFLIIIPLFLYIAFWISSRMDNKLPNFSVSNKSAMGYSVFYEVLKEFNYPVEKTLKPIDSFRETDMQIIAKSGSFNINSDDVKIWVKKGGIIIYLVTNDFYSLEYGVTPQTKDNLKIYNYGKGTVIICDAGYLTNTTLKNNTDKAYELLKEINNYSFNKIFFNETYMFVEATNKTLWDYLPLELKYILYQLFLVIAAFFYYKGKPFGKAVPLYEEVERRENEYLYSAASLFRQAKSWDIMVDTYYNNFIKQLNCHKDDWLDYWEKEQFPDYEKAKKVYLFQQNREVKHKEKDYKEIIKALEELKWQK